MSRAKLAVVRNEPEAERGPEDRLALLLPALAGAEMVVGKLRREIAEHGRALARKRGVAFIREEALKQEFGTR